MRCARVLRGGEGRAGHVHPGTEPPWVRDVLPGGGPCRRALLFSQPHLLLSILHQSQILLQVPGSEAQVSASPDHVLLARCHQRLEGCPHACSSSQKELMVLVCVCFRGLAGARPPPGLTSRGKRFSRAFNPSKKQHTSGAALGAGVIVASRRAAADTQDDAGTLEVAVMPHTKQQALGRW